MQKKAVEGASAHFDIFNALTQVIWYFNFLHLNTILKNDVSHKEMMRVILPFGPNQGLRNAQR